MKRPTYCPFQNISYMIRRAYREAPVILPVAAGMIVAGTAINILELVTAPAILDAVERNVPIAALLRMIAALTAAMLLCAANLSAQCLGVGSSTSSMSLEEMAQAVQAGIGYVEIGISGCGTVTEIREKALPKGR